MTDELPIIRSKAATLAALFNASRQQGMGSLDRSGALPMTEAEAQAIINDREGDLYFDYLNGRVMKLSLGGETFNPRLYDRDNGPGAAKAAIETLRASQQ